MHKLSAKELNTILIDISAGDRKALKDLYISTKSAIFLYIKSVVKNREAAEDITQQVFLEIMECVSKYRSGTNAKAWIFTIARNLCFDYLKKDKREIASDIIEVEHSKTMNERTLVFEALEQLDDIERQIAVLYIFCGFSQMEIAKILQMPYMRVRSKYGYAIKKLKKFYGGNKNDDQTTCTDNEK